MSLLTPRRYRPALELLEDRCTPATFTVTGLSDVVDPLDGKLTLREAIGRANTRAGQDTIVFKAGLEGTIRLTGGEILIDDHLVIQGPGAKKIAVSGNFSSRIFSISDPDAVLNVTIKGLEFRKGHSTGLGGAIASSENLTLVGTLFTLNHSDQSGGAIRSTGNLVVKKSTITGNSADVSGGGISCTDATIARSTIAGNRAGGYGGGILGDTVTLTRSTLSGNTASSHGGGMYCNDTATITSSTISGNRSAADGGGIQFTKSAIVTGSTITGNTAVGKGGGFSGGIIESVVRVTGSTITHNTAGTHGGGIAAVFTVVAGCTVSGNAAGANGGGIAGPFVAASKSTIADNQAGGNGGGISCGQAVITDSILSSNRAGTDGGGLYIITAAGENPRIRNSTFSGNRAGGDGGGIWSSKFDMKIFNSTLAFNRADGRGGGLFAQGNVHTLESTLIADNESGSSGDEDLDNGVGGSFAMKNCLVGVAIAASITDNGGNLIGTAAAPIDPRLAPLANNGGKTKTHALKKGSPAINAGSNPDQVGKDQRGGAFKRKVGSRVDIGAFERQ